MSKLAANLLSVETRIERACELAGRVPGEVTLVAVSKSFPSSVVVEAHALGVRHFGENRVQEAASKIAETKPVLSPITWHMIGSVQHRKVKDAVDLFDIIESVDSLELARRIESRLASEGRQLPVLVQVNSGGEPTKHGFLLSEKEALYQAVDEIARLPHLRLEGLMTIAPMVSDPEDARPYFRSMRELRSELRERFPAQSLQELSMGMTDDFQVAITEGATIIRIGRAIFGER